MEAGDRRLLRWYSGRLVRPTADTALNSSSHASSIISSDADSFFLSEQEDERIIYLSL